MPWQVPPSRAGLPRTAERLRYFAAFARRPSAPCRPGDGQRGWAQRRAARRRCFQRVAVGPLALGQPRLECQRVASKPASRKTSRQRPHQVRLRAVWPRASPQLAPLAVGWSQLQRQLQPLITETNALTPPRRPVLARIIESPSSKPVRHLGPRASPASSGTLPSLPGPHTKSTSGTRFISSSPILSATQPSTPATIPGRRLFRPFSRPRWEKSLSSACCLTHDNSPP